MKLITIFVQLPCSGNDLSKFPRFRQVIVLLGETCKNLALLLETRIRWIGQFWIQFAWNLLKRTFRESV
jgi:hypothetical protein